MTSPANCLECDTPLASAETGGLCPRCLLKLGLANTGFGFTRDGLTHAAPGGQPLDFGSYRIIRVLGKGGMGAVYEAEQKDSGRRVALKILGQTLETPESRGRFLREGRLAASVRHPNVVGIIAAEEIEKTAVISMELLQDGSLSDRVGKEGPMSVPAAVDAILQIIDGLEAAQSAGVLHRDVKPSNCFISAEGVVKVGDFGLSVSPDSQLEHNLTQSGVIMGTPAYASPEQMRGEEVDLRSDIYSTGGTLYYLLTGQTPYDADSLAALISAVLTSKPPDPRSIHKNVPAALSRVVMRSMAKDRGQRHGSYASLRAALEPFRSAAPRPGRLGLRVVAGLIDGSIVFIPQFVLESRNAGVWPANPGWQPFWAWTACVAWALAYFASMETRWGSTFGKMLCGLRVARNDGGPPGISRALLRSLVYQLPWIAPPLLTALGNAWGISALGMGIGPALLIALVATMRRRNGFAMLHDLISGTRVVALPAEDSTVIAQASLSMDSSEVAGLPFCGPFVVVHRREGLAEGWDQVLRRAVWIVPSEGSAALPISRQVLSRPGRLRWLQGNRDPAPYWDAFESPPGSLLSDLCDGTRSWNQVRRWMSEITAEYMAAAAQDDMPSSISSDRVWITSQGHAVWLEFPLSRQPVATEYATPDLAAFQLFLGDMAVRATAPHPPLHASELTARFLHHPFATAEALSEGLQETLALPAAITPRKRLMCFALWPVLALAFSIIVAITLQLFAEPELQQLVEERQAISIDISGTPPEDRPPPVTAGPGGLMIGDVPLPIPVLRFFVGSVLFLALVGAGACVSVLWAVATGIPPTFHLHGLALTTRRGTPAPRWKVILRTLISGTGALALGTGIVLLSVFTLPEARDSTLFWVSVLFLAVAGGAAIQALVRPSRAIPDFLLGTFVVPR